MQNNIKFALCFLAILLLFCLPGSSQICSDCKITPVSVRNTRIANAEAALVTAESEQEELRERHLPFGIPIRPTSASNERLIYQREWITLYDEDLRVPLWVAYELKANEAGAQRVRLDCFRHDPRLEPQAMSGCSDYEDSGFDRGHMVPADDLKRSATSLDNSFLLSNMSPQFEKFNRVVWRRLEGKVNKWAITSGSIYVITGAIFDRDGDGQRGDDGEAELFPPENRIAKATHFYKIIVHKRPNGMIDTISFKLPHNKRKNSKDSYFKSKITTVDAIEAFTGIDFFPEMEDTRQANIEAGKATGLGSWFSF